MVWKIKSDFTKKECRCYYISGIDWKDWVQIQVIFSHWKSDSFNYNDESVVVEKQQLCFIFKMLSWKYSEDNEMKLPPNICICKTIFCINFKYLEIPNLIIL